MAMPQDPVMLYSYINTQLRDKYPSLEEFCKANCCEKQELCSKLAAAGFEYIPELNKFM